MMSKTRCIGALALAVLLLALPAFEGFAAQAEARASSELVQRVKGKASHVVDDAGTAERSHGDPDDLGGGDQKDGDPLPPIKQENGLVPAGELTSWWEGVLRALLGSFRS